MASAPTHIVATGAIAVFFHRLTVPWHLWFAGAVLAVLPDFDVIGFRLGIGYGDLLGHRGLSHSLAFAATISGLVALSFYRDGAGILTAKQAWFFLFLAMASHGVLDAFTNGGLGVAFFSPFVTKRYFFPIRPLEVSPLSIHRFLNADGLAILLNEIQWVWVPTVAVAGSVLSCRHWMRTRSVASRAA
jgi:inner membrane protein